MGIHHKIGDQKIFGLYSYISHINTRHIFIFAIIFLVLLILFRNKQITSGIVLAIVLTVFVAIYLTDKRHTVDKKDEEEIEEKTDRIRPYIEDFNRYEDLSDFLFSVQEYYYSNPEAYEELLINTKNFLQIYENAIKTPEMSHDLYQLADDKRHACLNSLHSMIITLPADTATELKLEKAMEVLEMLLTNYQEQIYYVTREDLYNRGYNVNYKVVDFGPKARNFYSDEKYTYDVF